MASPYPMVYPSGVPFLSAYRFRMTSPEFRTLEKYSAQFLSDYAEALLPYSQRWHPDPLHAWSRRWEYPWVTERLTQDHSILDAGSGCTFFPNYLAALGANVVCVDADPSLAQIYAEMPGPTFHCAPLDAIPAEDGEFDAVACISVLEHTGERDKIIQEFHRVLRPGGKLLVTFDVSLDGRHEISKEGAAGLLAHLQREFAPVDPVDLSQLEATTQILTSREGMEYDAALIPPSMRTSPVDVAQVLDHRGWLTVVCAEFIRE